MTPQTRTSDGAEPGSALAGTLVLGLGNDILTDDAIGLRIAAELRKQLPGDRSIFVAETGETGLALLDLVAGFKTLVLVDAIQTNQAAPGFVHEMDGNDLHLLPPISPHFLGIAEVLALGRQLDLAMPEHVKVFAVEVQDALTVGTQMTPALETALPGLVKRVLDSLRAAR